MLVKRYSKKSTGPALLFVKAEWCGYCQQTKPEIRKVAQTLGSVLPVYEIDSDRDADVVKTMKIDGYPTIFFRTDTGRLIKYPGSEPRTARNIADWACAKSGMCTGRLT